ncbi:RNA polymerase sigma factor SigJ [Yinghuangia soli]|uniref:RNA polymerase sigma factor SigJ n=1 Tax=Yinghuangia soli TaxID=2908204 RepID=A0AA41Q8L2_9ACTN|nr:RNA polymerase sigma factor SigJ [Yinghuangia soli]MCF2532746.1 RNA polymerase sigma factor SigJ [Yinghuangia soli]
MDEKEFLAQRFEENRAHLRAVAYRMLGSLAEAEDAVQEAWFKLTRSDRSEVENLGGWLTTVVGRVCLDMLRTRSSRRESPLDTPHVPDPIVSSADGDPEFASVQADSVGLALLVVLETLPPAERLAFVLHDMFAVPFDEIGPIVGRTPAAARQLASRARRRVRGLAPEPEADRAKQREVVDAFFAAARDGDFEALVKLLDPDVVLRADVGAGKLGINQVLRGAEAVARQALMFQRFASTGILVLVNGSIGSVSAPEGKPVSVTGFTIVDGRIAEMDILADPDRLARLDFEFLDA